jgi:hypothetical protein
VAGLAGGHGPGRDLVVFATVMVLAPPLQTEHVVQGAPS